MIQSVQRAAQILVVLGSGTPRLGVTEIADRLGLAKPVGDLGDAEARRAGAEYDEDLGRALHRLDHDTPSAHSAMPNNIQDMPCHR